MKLKVKLKTTFSERLARQVKYIASNSPIQARKFKNSIIDKILKIPDIPYSYRKSIFFDNMEIRELIFKGYIIVFRINKTENIIEVFGLTKYQQSPTD